MKTNAGKRESLLGHDLYRAIAEICNDDQDAFENMVNEAIRALSEVEYLELYQENSRCRPSDWLEDTEMIGY